MVKLRKNLLIKGLIGSVNKQLVLKQYGKTTVVTSYPDMSKVVKTEKQKKENKRFKEAVAYANTQMANPVAKAEYQARTKGLQRAFNIAIADFYNPPEITKVDTSAWKGRMGDVITIHATDDFRVEKVMVEISDTSGSILESASAQKITAVKWECSLQKEYTHTDNLLIKVSAWDRPGNVAIWEGRNGF
jgi:hypothetical protein